MFQVKEKCVFVCGKSVGMIGCVAVRVYICVVYVLCVSGDQADIRNLHALPTIPRGKERSGDGHLRHMLIRHIFTG